MACALLALPGVAAAFFADPGGGAPVGVGFDRRGPGTLVVQTPVYQLTLAKQNGALLEVFDRTSDERIVEGGNGCLWGVTAAGDDAYVGGCAFTPSGSSRFSYRWDEASSTLTLTYEPDPAGQRPVRAVVTLHAARSSFDLRLSLENRTQHPLERVSFPADLIVDTGLVDAGYAPSFLPGVRLRPSFFSRPGNDVLTYPSRWAFADYLALDLGGSHLALSTVNPAPAPIAPVDLGFVHSGASGRPCSDASFCVVHSFDTWIAPGAPWTSPLVRVRVAEPVEQTIADYRTDNGIDAYPSVADKAGPRLAVLAQAPLVKADLGKGLPAFRDWAAELGRLPSPALLHPVAFGPGGFDASDPDVLPPDSRYGTTGDFRTAVDAAHRLGQLVMPYLNVSWWNPQSPTVQSLPPPLTPASLAVQRSGGAPVTEQFSGHDGYVVSPFVPYVRQRVDEELERWRTDVPADCLFFDQIGARPWLRDFNPSSPTPLAYEDGWLGLMSPYADRCLMVEDGWDRLAATFVGFDGSLMLMQREFDWLDEQWGEGTWEPFPLALWLFHDKVLLYQHDLYDETLTSDPEMLTWNLAYGYMLSYAWNDLTHTLDSPWLGLVAALQRALGPHYAGVALSSYRTVAHGVTETRFGDYAVLADWSRAVPYGVDGDVIAPGGFLARTDGGSVIAGAFTGTFDGHALSDGVHYLVVQRGQDSVTVEQPLGADTSIAVEPPPGWHPGAPLHATALAADGSAIGDVPGAVEDGRFLFEYAAAVHGSAVASYRVSAG